MEPWPLPQLDIADGTDGADAGPVMVSALWSVEPEKLEGFLALARELRHLRDVLEPAPGVCIDRRRTNTS